MPGIIKNMIKEKTQNKLVQHINYNKKSEAEKNNILFGMVQDQG